MNKKITLIFTLLFLPMFFACAELIDYPQEIDPLVSDIEIIRLIFLLFGYALLVGSILYLLRLCFFRR